ncbi:MAG: oligosaccharide flippase family protein, partial [Gaiellaceae bacterium]
MASADRSARSRHRSTGIAKVIAGADETALDLLRTPEAGGRVVRGGLIRGIGFGVSTALGLATAVLLLRYLGVDEFGQYATVSAVLGIVAGITDAGLTAVAGREISVARTAQERARLLSHLLLLRIAGATLGVLAGVAFTVLAGYDSVVVAGTALGGLGVILISAQSMLTVPIWVELRIVSLTTLEVLRNALTLAGVAALVLAGAGLVAFFGVQVVVALVLIPVTLLLARAGVRLASGVRRELLVWLVRETFPLAVAFAMSVIYFRVLVVLVSLLSSEEETGIFGTSFRIFELLLGLPALILSVALPLLSVAGDEDDERLRKGLQSMTEASLLIAGLLVVGIGILAEPGIRLIGGEEYIDAASVLRIQALALIPLFLGQVWQLGLI